MTTKNIIEHIPWTTRNLSQSEGVNFLFQHQNIFITDNHRLTPWILSEMLSTEKKYNYFHLDAHEDAKSGLLEKAPTNWIDYNLDEYIQVKDKEFNCALFRWDNYLPLIFKNFSFRHKIAATHQIGQLGDFNKRIGPELLYRTLQSMFTDELQWVMNIDLDYFYARDFKDSPFINEKYIEACFGEIKKHHNSGDIKTIIVALSPECCGGWPQAEYILDLFTSVFDLPKLQPTTKLIK